MAFQKCSLPIWYEIYQIWVISKKHKNLFGKISYVNVDDVIRDKSKGLSID